MPKFAFISKVFGREIFKIFTKFRNFATIRIANFLSIKS